MKSLRIVLINMIGSLKVSVKLATLHLLKIRCFEIKVITPYFLLMTSPTKFYHLNQIIF